MSDIHIGNPVGRFAKIRSLFSSTLRANQKNLRVLVDHITAHQDPSTCVVVITGDLVDNGSQSELDAAADELSYLVAHGFELHIQPGNHDVGRSGLFWSKRRSQRHRYCVKDLTGFGSWPYTVEYGDWNLVCLDSTIKTKSPLSMAQGDIGGQQIPYLAARPPSVHTVIALHHSPLGGHPLLRLRDRREFQALTNRDRYRCIYGHLHKRAHFYSTDAHCEMIAADASTESMSYQIVCPLSGEVEVVYV